MKLHNINKLPVGFEHYTLDKIGADDLPGSLIEAWYWYGSGDYCGTGTILMKTGDGLFHLHNCGHCSCYGPTDGIDLTNGAPLEALWERCSEVYKKEVVELFDGARAAQP